MIIRNCATRISGSLTGLPVFCMTDNGFGIGLSLCKQIVALHGGSIRVTSEEGRAAALR